MERGRSLVRPGDGTVATGLIVNRPCGCTGSQSGLPSQPGPGLTGIVTGHILTDTPADPTLFLGSSVDNDTGGSWVGYQVNVVMSVAFTFSGTPSVSTAPASGWLLAGTPTTPTLQVGGPYNGLYEGTINFSDGGTPLAPGDELDFSYAVHFGSSLDSTVTQEMIPIFAEVPEPGTLGLAAMGSLALTLRLRRNSRACA